MDSNNVTSNDSVSQVKMSEDYSEKSHLQKKFINHINENFLPKALNSLQKEKIMNNSEKFYIAD